MVVSARSFLLFVFGLCATVFLTEVGKISSGVLRPNFIDLCRPNVTCRGREANAVFYYNQYVCQVRAVGCNLQLNMYFLHRRGWIG